MKLRKFFSGRAIVLAILIIAGLFVFAYQKFGSNHEYITAIIPEETEEVTMTGSPVFTWRFKESKTLNQDGLPQTEVYIDATYGSKNISRLVAVAEGGCNDLQEAEKDSVTNSTVAQCYAAGYGERFKVTRGQDSYLVKKKGFEEGLPDYNPPAQEYVAIVEFSF